MIVYTDDPTSVRPEQLEGGFWAEWPDPPSSANHLKILHRSYAVWLALDDEADIVVGFINAISDGIHAAYVPLLEVRGEYQGRGIGTELVRRMLETLQHLYQIDLMCDDELQPFYERFGIKPSGGMIIRNYHRQNGSPPATE